MAGRTVHIIPLRGDISNLSLREATGSQQGKVRNCAFHCVFFFDVVSKRNHFEKEGWPQPSLVTQEPRFETFCLHGHRTPRNLCNTAGQGTGRGRLFSAPTGTHMVLSQGSFLREEIIYRSHSGGYLAHSKCLIKVEGMNKRWDIGTDGRVDDIWGRKVLTKIPGGLNPKLGWTPVLRSQTSQRYRWGLSTSHRASLAVFALTVYRGLLIIVAISRAVKYFIGCTTLQHFV